MGSIFTERLELVPLALGDAAAILNGRPRPDRPGVSGYPCEGTLVRAGLVVTASREGAEPSLFRIYEIIRREDGLAIGSCGFHAPPNEDGHVSIGCSLAASVRGHGYGGEALGGLVGFARSRPEVRRLTSEVTRANVAGQRVLERAGLRLERSEGELLYYAA